MTTQLTIKQGIQEDFAAYMRTVELSKLGRKIQDMEIFKESLSYGDDVIDVRIFIDGGQVMVSIKLGYYGCASGYHSYGSADTYSLKEAIQFLDLMKTRLGDTIYQPQYSGYQMGVNLDLIKKELLSI